MDDLRVMKTKKAIEDAFLSLRDKYDLDKIKISELCSLAMINKTTFYNYYDDVYDLCEKLENKYFEKSFFGFDSYDCLIHDTEKFIYGIYKSFITSNEIRIIFKNRISTLVEKAQNKVLEYYKDYVCTERVKMKLMFLIHGAFYLLFNYNGEQNEKEKLKIIVEYAKTLWDK